MHIIDNIESIPTKFYKQ